MGVSVYKGEAASYGVKPAPVGSSGALEIFLGHVIALSYEEASVGAILVKLIDVDKVSDDKISRVAYPANLNVVKYPLPGELVFVFNGIGSSTINNIMGSQLYYLNTITANNSITFNSNPYFTTYETRKSIRQATDNGYEVRFENKLKNVDTFKKPFPSKEVIEKPALKPFEGDFILQGRVGAGIRLSSSTTNPKANPWSEKGGIAGDAITIVSVNKSRGTTSRVEDVNKDDASIYMCQSQTIPVHLSLSSMQSLKTTFNSTIQKDPIPDPLLFIDTPYEEVLRSQYNNTGNSSRADDPSNPKWVLSPVALGLHLLPAEVPGAAALAYQLLLEREGTSIIPGWDVNNWRLGHGSDEITIIVSGNRQLVVKLDNRKSMWPNKWINRDKGILGYTDIGNAVERDGQKYGKKGDRLWKGYMSGYSETPGIITAEEADRDLARRLMEDFLPKVFYGIKYFGGTMDTARALGPGAIAALTSIAYNYGNIYAWGEGSPGRVAAEGDLQKLVDFIATIYERGYGGSSARHQREAAYAAGLVPLVT